VLFILKGEILFAAHQTMQPQMWNDTNAMKKKLIYLNFSVLPMVERDLLE